ncbi:hypothetical protein J6590_014636 [Homalodisca vitripennis]|nr:hypothetical protein J6590_014636 [Homalodisca vitripennis]
MWSSPELRPGDMAVAAQSGLLFVCNGGYTVITPQDEHHVTSHTHTLVFLYRK